MPLAESSGAVRTRGRSMYYPSEALHEWALAARSTLARPSGAHARTAAPGGETALVVAQRWRWRKLAGMRQSAHGVSNAALRGAGGAPARARPLSAVRKNEAASTRCRQRSTAHTIEHKHPRLSLRAAHAPPPATQQERRMPVRAHKHSRTLTTLQTQTSVLETAPNQAGRRAPVRTRSPIAQSTGAKNNP